MQVSTLTRPYANNAATKMPTNAEVAVNQDAPKESVELSASPKRPSLMTLNLNVRPEIKVDAKPPETGYSNVTDLKSLREERDKKAEEMRVFRQALAGGKLIDAVECEINKVAYLSDKPANKSLKTDQVILDQHRSLLGLVSKGMGNAFIGFASKFVLGSPSSGLMFKLPAGTDAVLNCGPDGKAVAFEEETLTTLGDKKYLTYYAKQPVPEIAGAFDYTVAKTVETDGQAGPTDRKTVRLGADGRLTVM